MGLFRFLTAIVGWKKILITFVIVYTIFWLFISYFSVKSARYLYRSENEIYAEINLRYEREGASAACWEKRGYSSEQFIGRANGYDKIENDGGGDLHLFKKNQIIVIYNVGYIHPNMTLVCTLHQINFNIFIPASNEFEITVK
ncbi:hypothetical protein [Aquitalea sp. USM4]|uniref:hypothetical protein n=1 Tax=Aquitalea sp. USM4 TaxID=1590041 RepID=UPI00103E3DA9|nr:hypothetical protein [Aquitalea sp. USM4]